MNQIDFAINNSERFRLHPLGFFYLAVGTDDDQSLRVHVWQQYSQQSVVSVNNVYHQHSYNLNSSIQMGSMTNEIVSFVKRSDGALDEFKVTYENERTQLSPTGITGDLELLSSFSSNKGEKYFLKAGVIHKASVTTYPCITFVALRDCGIPVFSYGNDFDEPAFNRRLVNQSEKNGIVRALKSL